MAEDIVSGFVPSGASIVDVAFKCAESKLADTLPKRWCHVQAVARRATYMKSLLSPSSYNLLQAAALLHDVGYAQSIAVTGFHALDGARYLRDAGFSERVSALVAHHSCAYLEAELRGLSAEIAAWEDEHTALRDALWWADMTTGPDGAVTNVRDRIEEIQKRYGPEHLVSFFIRQAEPELVAAAERTEQRLLAAGIDYTVK